MKWFNKRTRRKNAETSRKRERRTEDDSDERFVVERMLVEGCPNAQPIAPGENNQTERSNLDEMASPRP